MPAFLTRAAAWADRNPLSLFLILALVILVGAVAFTAALAAEPQPIPEVICR